MDFTVVSSEHRDNIPKPKTRKLTPITSTLLNKETIFVPYAEKANNNLASYYDIARRHGMKFSARRSIVDEVDGYLCWMEDRNAE